MNPVEEQKIVIFDDEIECGLAELIQNNNSAISCEVEAKPSKMSQITMENWSKSSNTLLSDLYFLDAILASTGLNLNDDFFDNNETFAARDTPINKPFDYEHKSSDIIGHIISCELADFDGNKIDLSNLNGKVPDSFEIPFTAALYRHYHDNKHKQERIDKIIAAIENPTEQDRWFVSMACRFRGFDYIMFPEHESTSSAKIVERTNDTAFLTKHLRAYGGTGIYNGNRVGRILRNMTFSGVGLVRRPGNPRSVIKNRSSGAISEKIDDISKILGYKTNSEETMDNTKVQEELNTVKAKLVEAEKQLADVAKSNFEKQLSDFQKQVEGLTAGLNASKAELEVAKTELEKAALSNKELKDQLEKFQAEAAQAEAARKQADRLAKVKDAYAVEDAEAKKFVDTLNALTDEAFAEHVNAIKSLKKVEVVAAPKTDATAALNTATPVKDNDVNPSVDADAANTSLAAEIEAYFKLNDESAQASNKNKKAKK